MKNRLNYKMGMKKNLRQCKKCQEDDKNVKVEEIELCKQKYLYSGKEAKEKKRWFELKILNEKKCRI